MFKKNTPIPTPKSADYDDIFVRKPKPRLARVQIDPITKNVELDPEPEPKKSRNAPIPECDRILLELTNRIICMITEYEDNMKRIGAHPTLDDDTKSDIQNYINKNIITALWVLEPAFPLLKGYERLRSFEALLRHAAKRGAPGVLQYKKHV
jgi:hypothetical protein